MIWNHALQRFDVASELTRAYGKAARTDKRAPVLVGVASAVAVALGASVPGTALAASKVDTSVGCGATEAIHAAETAVAIGTSSILVESCQSTATFEVAIGRAVVGTCASNSVALGSCVTTNASSSVVIGYRSNVTYGATSSVVIGEQSYAATSNSIALGSLARANASYAGSSSSDSAVAIGSLYYVNGSCLTRTVASGNQSLAIGAGTQAMQTQQLLVL